MPMNVAVCAIVKDEGRFLLEWISYYVAIGVDSFILYDNGSTDGSIDLLMKLGTKLDITLISWPSPSSVHSFEYSEVYDALDQISDAAACDWEASIWFSPQIAAYNHALANFGPRHDWILFVDADEFLVPIRDRSIKDVIARCAGRDEVGAIAVNEKYFGSSGRERYEDRPVIERFTRCAPPRFDGHLHIKTLVRPSKTALMFIHGAKLRDGVTVNDLGETITVEAYAFSPAISMYYAQLNHYSVKSREEFALKKAKGRAHVADDHIAKFADMDDAYFRRQDRNEDTDLSIQRFLAATLHNMAVLRTECGLAGSVPETESAAAG